MLPRIVRVGLLLLRRCKVCKVTLLKVFKGALTSIEEQFNFSNGSISVLFNENLSDVRALTFILSFVFAVNEDNHVSVLLDRTRVSKVRKARSTATLLHST